MESSIEQFLRLNQTREQFEPLMEYFIVNSDESCLMSSNGNIYVVTSKANINTVKRTDNLWVFIITLWNRFKSGHQSTSFFLAQGKKLNRNRFKNLNFFYASEGYEVIITPNAFMTDKAWLKIVPKLCRSIRNQEVIRDHPDWRVLMSLDDF